MNGRTAKRETLIPLVTNSRRSLHNDATVANSRSSFIEYELHRTYEFFMKLRQGAMSTNSDAREWFCSVDRGRKINRSIFAADRIAMLLFIEHRNAITCIELKLKKAGLNRNQNGTRLVSTSSWRFLNPRTTGIFTKSGSGVFVSTTSSLSVIRVIWQFTVHRNRVVYR